jgi:hypothetical protein
MRGRVIGGWIFAIGFGWVGHLGMGAVGEVLGVRWALAINGMALALLGLGLLAFNRRLKTA